MQAAIDTTIFVTNAICNVATQPSHVVSPRRALHVNQRHVLNKLSRFRGKEEAHFKKWHIYVHTYIHLASSLYDLVLAYRIAWYFVRPMEGFKNPRA